MSDASTAAQRERMVRDQIEGRGLRSASVLRAMREVPREHFAPPHLRERAYDDTALPIGSGQTISQPFIVAYMAEALELLPSDRVLEIGTGSGYGAALLARLASRVFTIERHRSLADTARERLRAIGCSNVEVRCGDGSNGWPGEAPFEAIVVTAGVRQVPQALQDQLAVGGRLVIPVGSTRRAQELLRLRRTAADRVVMEPLTGVRFVPLIGDEGWPDPDDG